MGRLINTGDLNNLLQMYNGFGNLREPIIGIVRNIIMDCPIATDDTVRDATIDRVLEIIDKYTVTGLATISAGTHNTLIKRMKNEVVALKRG